MAVFPVNPIPRYSSARGVKLEAIRSESEAGYTAIRKKFTRAKAFFNLEYQNITMAEYAMLEDFFLTNQGSIFDFVYPLQKNKTYSVLFANDTIERTDNTPNRCSTKIQLVEA